MCEYVTSLQPPGVRVQVFQQLILKCFVLSSRSFYLLDINNCKTIIYNNTHKPRGDYNMSEQSKRTVQLKN